MMASPRASGGSAVRPSPDEVRAAAKSDLESIAVSRAGNNAAAGEIAEELADLEADLRLAVAVADEAGEELPETALDSLRRRRGA